MQESTTIGDGAIDRRDTIKALAATAVGTLLEMYDFILYGTAAALVFNGLFFPQVSPIMGTLAALATFGVGFLARPLGGMVFGHYGDKLGRKRMLVITMLMMGVASTLIGLLPTYEMIGIWAAVLLVLLRLVQGFGVGGEQGGAFVLAAEYAFPGRRGFFGSWPASGIVGGLLIATLVFSIFSRLPEEQFLSWGWRVPFLLSIVLVGVGLYIRLTVEETPAFRRVERNQAQARVPILEAARGHWKQVLLIIGMKSAETAYFWGFATFALAYATEQLGLPRGLILNGVLLGAAAEVVTIPIFGALSDRVGRRPVWLMGSVFLALFVFPFFWLINTGSTALVWLALVLGLGVGHAALGGPQAAFFSELFGTRLRYSGVSLGVQLASMIAGGFTPFIAAALLAWSGSYWPVAVYLGVLALIAVLAALIAPETFRKDLSKVD